MDKRLQAFQHLLHIMDDLREKCPWDKNQTLESLRHLTIEETYELADAILDEDLDGIRGELGDLMLHIVFYARIGSEKGAFDITSVLDGINEKLIRRHPHIYGDVKAETADEVKDNWEKIKLKTGKKRVLSGVPKSLPAMIKAYRIQDKVKGVGFDWEEPHQVWEKVQEEMEELKEAVGKHDAADRLEKTAERQDAPNNHGVPGKQENAGKQIAAREGNQTTQKRMEEEFGDLLFALINYARFIGVNPENALERTNKKFVKRFEHLEEQARKTGQDMKKMNLAEMDVFWNEAKEMENGSKK